MHYTPSLWLRNHYRAFFSVDLFSRDISRSDPPHFLSDIFLAASLPLEIVKCFGSRLLPKSRDHFSHNFKGRKSLDTLQKDISRGKGLQYICIAAYNMFVTSGTAPTFSVYAITSDTEGRNCPS